MCTREPAHLRPAWLRCCCASTLQQSYPSPCGLLCSFRGWDPSARQHFDLAVVLAACKLTQQHSNTGLLGLYLYCGRDKVPPIMLKQISLRDSRLENAGNLTIYAQSNWSDESQCCSWHSNQGLAEMTDQSQSTVLHHDYHDDPRLACQNKCSPIGINFDPNCDIYDPSPEKSTPQQ